jgi:transposase-like protein
MQAPSSQRKRYASDEKFKIVKEHLSTRTPVSEICKKYGVAPSAFYNWQDQFFSSARAGFDAKRGPKQTAALADSRLAEAQAEIARMREVIAEITAENIAFKKKNSYLLR